MMMLLGGRQVLEGLEVVKAIEVSTYAVSIAEAETCHGIIAAWNKHGQLA